MDPPTGNGPTQKRGMDKTCKKKIGEENKIKKVKKKKKKRKKKEKKKERELFYESSLGEIRLTTSP